MAPAIVDYRPVPAERPEPGRWYSHDLEYGPANVTDLNVFFYGMTLEGSRPELTYVSFLRICHEGSVLEVMSSLLCTYSTARSGGCG